MTALTDLTFLTEFSKGDNERMKKYIQMFVNLAPGQLDQIKEALGAKDWPSLRTAAHSLKPQINYMGIETLKETVLKVEHSAADQENLEELPELVTSLDDGVRAAISELEEKLKTL